MASFYGQADCHDCVNSWASGMSSGHIWTDDWSTSPISRIEDRSSRPIRHRHPRMAMATPLLLCSSILKFSCSSQFQY